MKIDLMKLIFMGSMVYLHEVDIMEVDLTEIDFMKLIDLQTSVARPGNLCVLLQVTDMSEIPLCMPVVARHLINCTGLIKRVATRDS